MILINKLKGRMREEGYTQDKLAKELGISPKTLSNKFNKGILGSDEMEKLITILDIRNPIEIFFSTKLFKEKSL